MRYLGPSMWPLFQDNDFLILSDIYDHKLEMGDIVCFKEAEEIIVHRLINERQTKGDFSKNLDDENSIEYFAIAVGVVQNNKKVIWGIKGQPLKKAIAFISLLRTKGKLISLFRSRQ